MRCNPGRGLVPSVGSLERGATGERVPLPVANAEDRCHGIASGLRSHLINSLKKRCRGHTIVIESPCTFTLMLRWLLVWTDYGSGLDYWTGPSAHGRRPGAEFGGTKKIFSSPISGKISIFRVKISDDLFFSHRPGSSDFPFLFSHFPYVYYVKCRI